MRPDSLLLNTSRSALIDSAGLAKAVKQGWPGFAALDVFCVEPLSVYSPLRRLPHVLLTQFLGFISELVFERFSTGVLNAWAHG